MRKLTLISKNRLESASVLNEISERERLTHGRVTRPRSNGADEGFIRRKELVPALGLGPLLVAESTKGHISLQFRLENACEKSHFRAKARTDGRGGRGSVSRRIYPSYPKAVSPSRRCPPHQELNSAKTDKCKRTKTRSDETRRSARLDPPSALTSAHPPTDLRSRPKPTRNSKNYLFDLHPRPK